MKIKTFLIEESDRFEVSLRRYGGDGCQNCVYTGYHNQLFPIGVLIAEDAEHLRDHCPDQSDERWPKACSCGYQFKEGDCYQVFTERIYVRKDNGQDVTLQNAPAGAIYRAPWLERNVLFCGEDGKSYVCVCPAKPDGSGRTPWQIDGPANNCTRKDESHKCWCRHGEAPDFHVDKIGNTCSAGAGSIQCREGWHGFLHNGYLVTC